MQNRPVVFTSTFLRKTPLTRQTRRTFNCSRANLNGPIRNTFTVFCWNQSETILLQGYPELLISLLYMRRRALGRDSISTQSSSAHVEERDQERLPKPISTGVENASKYSWTTLRMSRPLFEGTYLQVTWRALDQWKEEKFSSNDNWTRLSKMSCL